MTVSGNYSAPVSVNGYQCWNCTDVANAKKHIDPQHPKSGPYGIDAFGGGVTGPAGTDARSSQDTTQDPGSQVDISA
jgi:hypothetical protein